MSSAARAEQPGRSTDGVSIGAVLRELQEDFPDLTVSKIRYLETEGLISPERRASGYRLFTPADVARLRFILTAQRDRFWPHKVIKDALDRLDRGLDVPGLTSPAEPGTEQDAPPPEPAHSQGATLGDLSAAALRRRRSIRLSPLELRERTGLDQGTYAQLKAFGLLRTDATGRHHADDLLFDVALSVERERPWPLVAPPVAIDPVTGEIPVITVSDDLVPDPGATVSIRDLTFDFPDDPEADRYRDWIRSAWHGLRHLGTGSTYVNFQTADEDPALLAPRAPVVVPDNFKEDPY